MDCSADPVNQSIEIGRIMQEADPYSRGTMQVIRHHIYEYEKGVRDLILHTVKQDVRESVVDVLKNIPAL